MAPKTDSTSLYSYINTQSSLSGLIEHIRKCERIALDTEADSYHHYFEKVCLIQLTLDGQNYIVDPLCDTDLSQFLNLLSQKQLIIHDAGYDLRIMRSSFGFRPHRKIFDTMSAAQLLGYEKFGLTAMIERCFGVTLTKKGQRSDWSRRPLKKSQLEYAVDDTKFLLPLAQKLERKLGKLGRLDWHRQSCENIMRSAMLEKPERDLERIWRIKGTSRLSPQQLQFVRALWFWRNRQAEKYDLPAFRIMGNAKIIDLALWVVNNPDSPIEKAPDLPRTFKGGRFCSLEKAIRKAQSTPPDDWPKLLKGRRNNRLSPGTKELIEALRSERSKIAESLSIAPQTLASAATLTNIAINRPETIEQMIEIGPMMPWQGQILAPAVQKIFKAR